MKSSRPSQNGFRDSLQYSDIPAPVGRDFRICPTVSSVTGTEFKN